MKLKTLYFSAAILLLLPGSVSAFAAGPEASGYVIRGRVISVNLEEKEDGSAICELTLDLEFVNVVSESVIILKPVNQYVYWLGARSLYKTYNEAALGKNPVYLSQAWPSIYPFPEYKDLAERLDKPAPPEDVTRILKPGETWTYRATTKLFFGKVGEQAYGNPTLPFAEIKNTGAPLWLRLDFETWPFNVENFRRGLGGKLRKRWRKIGRLWLEETNSRFWFASHRTEPIKFDLQGAKKG
jgi:hypothetical protein